MLQPLVSIVMCTYNGERFLKKQIDSLLDQTYQNIEIVIVDDASTDSTVNIIQSYLPKANISLYINKTNVGYNKNFEAAISKANGNYIAFCDQDDIWMPNKIDRLLAKMGNALLVYSDSLLIDDTDKSLNKKLSHISKMYTGNCTKGFILWNVVWGHTMLINKSLIHYCLPIPNNIPYDIWLAFKATTLSGIVYVNEVLTHYRQHLQNVTTTTFQKQANKKSRARKERYPEFLKNLNWFKLMLQHERESEKEFYKKLIQYYSQKEKGFAFKLFFFMLRHHNDFFRFRYKSFLSRVIEIRKQCRYEKM